MFFSTGGGEAVETAFKLAKQYWRLQGKPTKHKVISRFVAYHGTPQGALAITGLPAMKSMFEPVTPGGFRERTLRLVPGRYRLWCTIADHRARGMQAALRVRPAR